MEEIEVKPESNSTDYVEDGKNKLNIYCFRCPSLILRPQVATYSSDENFELPKMAQQKNSPSVQTDTVTKIFRVEDIMEFENVGFSKCQQDVKYLICSDCEYGPLGWFKNQKSFIALERVRFELDS